MTRSAAQIHDALIESPFLDGLPGAAGLSDVIVRLEVQRAE